MTEGGQIEFNQHPAHICRNTGLYLCWFSSICDALACHVGTNLAFRIAGVVFLLFCWEGTAVSIPKHKSIGPCTHLRISLVFVCSKCTFYCHDMSFCFFSNPSQHTSPQTSLFIFLFPFFSPPRTLLLSSSFPRPPPSQHARGGFRWRKAIYDHQPMARFNPFASSTHIRASEIKRDKQK